MVKRWTEEARPYGDEWMNDVRLRALRAVASSKSLAKVTVELAQEADKVVSDADLDTKVTVLTFLGRAAKESGMEKLAIRDRRSPRQDRSPTRRRVSQEGPPIQTDRLFGTERRTRQTRPC